MHVLFRTTRNVFPNFSFHSFYMLNFSEKHSIQKTQNNGTTFFNEKNSSDSVQLIDMAICRTFVELHGFVNTY